jgi:hypothetical protein
MLWDHNFQMLDFGEEENDRGEDFWVSWFILFLA